MRGGNVQRPQCDRHLFTKSIGTAHQKQRWRMSSPQLQACCRPAAHNLPCIHVVIISTTGTRRQRGNFTGHRLKSRFQTGVVGNSSLDTGLIDLRCCGSYCYGASLRLIDRWKRWRGCSYRTRNNAGMGCSGACRVGCEAGRIVSCLERFTRQQMRKHINQQRL